MKWNIFKRIAELEATINKLQLQINMHSDLHFARQTVPDFRAAPVKAEGKPIPLSKDELKRERILQTKRNYYQRNREKILAQRKKKQKQEDRKIKAREYAKKYYAHKKLIKNAQVDQKPYVTAAYDVLV